MIKKDPINQVMVVFSLTMVVLILLLGIFLLLTPALSYLPKNLRTIFALGLIVYGFFRLVIIYQKYKKREE